MINIQFFFLPDVPALKRLQDMVLKYWACHVLLFVLTCFHLTCVSTSLSSFKVSEVMVRVCVCVAATWDCIDCVFENR